MKVLITGGAGYIGSTLVPLLLQHNHQVTVLDNMLYRAPALLDVCHNPHFQIINGDVRDGALLKRLVAQHDVLLPLACLTGAPACNKDPISAVAIGQEHVINMYNLKSSAQLMLYPCTNSGYGISQVDLACDEDSPIQPISLYGKLKVTAESHLLEGGRAVTFRLATVFGASPRMRLDLLVNDFVYRAVEDRAVVLFEPHFKRNFLHVRDAARVFLHAIENYSAMQGRAFNVGLSDANLSKLELCQKIQAQIPEFQFPIAPIGEDPDKRNYIVSNARIEATGFKTQHSLEPGIGELIKCFQVVRRNQYSNV